MYMYCKGRGGGGGGGYVTVHTRVGEARRAEGERLSQAFTFIWNSKFTAFWPLLVWQQVGLHSSRRLHRPRTLFDLHD